MSTEFKRLVKEIKWLDQRLSRKDFLLTWELSLEELKQVLYVAEGLKFLYSCNISTRCFDSGLAVSQFKDHSTRTRFSFVSAANLVGLGVQELDEGKSQIAHGETLRETVNMISFLTEIIGIRDDMYVGVGHNRMKKVAAFLDEGFREGVLAQRPGIINLQCDLDHPTQTLADLLHLKSVFGSLENLKGKKMAMTWAYSPSYGKPLSVPQGMIALMTRMGMEVTLAHPKEYALIPEVTALAQKHAAESGGSFRVVHAMDEAFKDADIVYPKSWAPFSVMQERTRLLQANDRQGLDRLERQCLLQNADYRDWECNEKRMQLTRDGKALYLHCLPADISGVSCKEGEVSSAVFEKYRTATYREAGCKPFIIASMMVNSRFPSPGHLLEALAKKGMKRVLK